MVKVLKKSLNSAHHYHMPTFSRLKDAKRLWKRPKLFRNLFYNTRIFTTSALKCEEFSLVWSKKKIHDEDGFAFFSSNQRQQISLKKFNQKRFES